MKSNKRKTKTIDLNQFFTFKNCSVDVYITNYGSLSKLKRVKNRTTSYVNINLSLFY